MDDKKPEDLEKELERLTRELEFCEERFRNTINKSADGIVIVDGFGFISFVNPSAESLFGRSADELLGSPFGFPVVAGETTEIVVLLSGRRAIAAMRVVETQWEGKRAFLAALSDITERKKMEEEIRHLALHDPLTDLPNRRFLLDIIRIEAAQARRRRTKAALLLMDLDRFKEVNDTLGHDTGDELLKQVAARFKAGMRESDMIARTGGDEFAIVAVDINRAEDTAEVAQKAVDSLREPFRIAGHEIHMSTSVGISLYPDDSAEINTLFQYADVAMYYAKERGRNCFQFYNPSINAVTLEKIRLETMLRRAIEHGELIVYYQPQMNIQSGQMIRAEALVRWRHPEMGLLEPGQFMPLAEESGFITAIDDWVLRAACAQVRAWLDAGLRPARVSVNISMREFQNPELVPVISHILEESGVGAESLIIEISETLAMSNIERTIHRLHELDRIGVRISIDDFGTGYSSLSRLKRLPVRTLKIDRSLIRGIETDAEDRAIIRAVTDMAHGMSMSVLAEGVETDDQLSFLRSTDCDEVQGFYFSRPLAAEQFAEAFLAGR